MRTRRGEYGIFDDIYQSLHMLEEFGLVDVRDTMKGRSRGKIKAFADDDPDGSRAPEPYRIIYPGEGTKAAHEHSAIDQATYLLNVYPVPPRLSDEINIAGTRLIQTLTAGPVHSP